MNQMHPRRRCGPANLNAHAFSPSCGTSLSSPVRTRGWKLFLGAFAICVGMAWTAACRSEKKHEPSSSRPPTSSSASSNLTPTPGIQALALTSAQHLAEARRALADGYKPDGDPKRASWGEVAAARWHLKAIGPGAPEYREAQALLKEVASRERQIELSSSRPGAKPSPQVAASDAAGGRTGGSSPHTANTAPASVGTRRQPPTLAGQTDELTVYLTRTGTKYHRAGCRYLSKSMIPTPLGDAKRSYSPCSVCKPPQ
jgi:hypothetical protein